MVVRKQKHVVIDVERLEQMINYKYLGCSLNENWKNTTEIRSSLYQKTTLFIPYSETWTLTDYTTKRIEVFQMWCYERMLRIS